MSKKTALRKGHRIGHRPPFEVIALLLQGGGALGSYQAGVYQALAEADLHPDWVAGISIGAINSAIIAGNPPDKRVERLAELWETITRDLGLRLLGGIVPEFVQGNQERGTFNRLSSATSLLAGTPGFFKPRLPPPYLQVPGSPGATSWYETAELRGTLERLVDFDRINAGEMRFTVGAVNVRTGNLTCFDNRTHRIAAEHVIASGSLPPGFPATEIEGEHYWDGGLVSNTPLNWVIDAQPPLDTLAFQVDLWAAQGAYPSDLTEVAARTKEIQYSSRTRLSTDVLKHRQKIRHMVGSLLDKLPPELRNEPEVDFLRPLCTEKVVSMIHLIYRTRDYENQAKDYEFSRGTMREHWDAGYHDAVRTLRHPEVLERPDPLECVRTFDLGQDSRE
jgi:NTE family protein